MIHRDCKGAEITEWMCLSKEALFGVCDAETRRAGQIVKAIYLMDFRYGSLLSHGGEFKEAMRVASKTTELFYPQLLLRTVVYKIPFGIGTILSIALKLFPSSVREKLVICDEGSRTKSGPWTAEALNIAMEDIPSYLGGTCECEMGCVRGVPNNQSGAVTEAEAWARHGTMADWSLFIGGRTIDRNKSRSAAAVPAAGATAQAAKAAK